jgi:hypothetical protein
VSDVEEGQDTEVNDAPETAADDVPAEIAPIEDVDATEVIDTFEVIEISDTSEIASDTEADVEAQAEVTAEVEITQDVVSEVGPPVCATSCDDGNACTDDTCEAGSCKHANNAVACATGNLCSIGDMCAAGSCVSSGQKDCNDNNPCTFDACQNGACKKFPDDGKGCDDGNKCTGSDTCTATKCAGVATNCDDKNSCTTDACDAATGNCTHTPVGPLYQEDFEKVGGKNKVLSAEWKLGEFWSTSSVYTPIAGTASLLADSPPKQSEVTATLVFPWKLQADAEFWFKWQRVIGGVFLVEYKMCDTKGVCGGIYPSGELTDPFDQTTKVVKVVLPVTATKIVWTFQANNNSNDVNGQMLVDDVVAYPPGCAPK